MIPGKTILWYGKQLRVWRAHNRSYGQLRERPHIYPRVGGTWCVDYLRGQQFRIRTQVFDTFSDAAKFIRTFWT
jgi:hypothetical protein